MIAQAKISFHSEIGRTLLEIEALLKQHGMREEDYGHKFKVTDALGGPVELWKSEGIVASITWQSVQTQFNGSLKLGLDNALVALDGQTGSAVDVDGYQNLSIRSQSGYELNGHGHLLRVLLRTKNSTIPPEEFPLSVSNNRPSKPPHNRFPLTFTFRQYYLNIDSSTVEAAAKALNGSLHDLIASPSELRDELSYFVSEELALHIRGSPGLHLSMMKARELSRWRDTLTGLHLLPSDIILEVNGLVFGQNTSDGTLIDAEVLLAEMEKTVRDALSSAGASSKPLRVRVETVPMKETRHTWISGDRMKERIFLQAFPRQLKLIEEFATGTLAAREQSTDEGGPYLRCVCGGKMKRLSLKDRVERMMTENMVSNGYGSMPIEAVMDMIYCDLCLGSIMQSGTVPDVYFCERGARTVLHADTKDICARCVNSSLEGRGWVVPRRVSASPAQHSVAEDVASGVSASPVQHSMAEDVRGA